MIKNWKAVAYMASPLCGESPAFDSLLEWELARRLGMKHHGKLTRDIPLSQIQKVPIPLAKRTINGKDIYCCSDAIVNKKTEWTDHQSKRIDTSVIASLLSPENRKSLLVASGPYKMRYAPLRVSLIDKIVWFFRGDKKEVNKLLKSVFSLGHLRNIGYGLIDHWEYEEQENDYSIFANQKGKPVLMKTIPMGRDLLNVTGYKKTFGGAAPPYWHPENYMEIAIPC